MRILIFLTFLLTGVGLSAQTIRGRIHYQVKLGDTTQQHQLILLDYSKVIGNAERLRNDTLIFRPHAAVEASAIPAGEIRYLGVFDSKEERIRRSQEKPGFTDLTYERTALPFQSKGKLKIINGVYVATEFNLNKNVQLGVGVAPLGIIATQRIRHSFTPKIHVALSNQTAYFPFFGAFDRNGAGVTLGDLTAIVTFGDERSFVNLGSGIFYNNNTREQPVYLQRAAIGQQLGKYWHGYIEAVLVMEDGERFRQMELLPGFTAAYGKNRHRWKFGVLTVVFDNTNFFPVPLPFLGYSLYW